MSRGISGSAAGNRPCDHPNGCPGGPTSLSGTGSSRYGGSTPGSTGKNQRQTKKKSCVIRAALINAAACRGPVGALPEQKRATYRPPA